MLGSRILGALLVVSALTSTGMCLELDLPIACTVGEDCFIQQYVDRNQGPGATDYACGRQTYNNHKGVDIRIRTTEDAHKGVAVLSAAPGGVVAKRDVLRDHLVRTQDDRRAVVDQECGNGVRIDHGKGWQTQYCHLRQGSIRVKIGDKVGAGAILGEVGYSGNAEFPHLHFQVTRGGNVVDPFLPETSIPCGTVEGALWSDVALAGLGYERTSLLALGLADGPVSLNELEAGMQPSEPSRATPIVAYLWAINLEPGDLVELTLSFENSIIAKNSESLTLRKAQYMLFAGKKAPRGGWSQGAYTFTARIIREGKVSIKESRTTMVD